MKLVREHINEDFKSVFKPLSQEQILAEINHMSQEEKDKRLISVAENNNIKLVELLLQAGADINAKNNYGWTALMWASKYGYKDVVKLLIKAGADINAKTYSGWTALISASGNGHIDVVELLLQTGADVNAKDNYGWTALTRASQKGQRDVVKLLKQYGAKE